MTGSLEPIFNHRLRALIRKEFGQIRRDRRLAVSLILPPTLQLLLLGFALSATVTNIKLGAVDDSRTPQSRELVATLSESKRGTTSIGLSLVTTPRHVPPWKSICRSGT